MNSAIHRLRDYFEESVIVHRGNYVGRNSLPDRAQKVMRRMVIKQLLKEKMESMLDLGCGPGDLLSDLRQLNRSIEIMGMDISEGMLNIAKKRVDGARFRKVDITKKLSRNKHYDAVVCLNTLHHLNLSQAERVLGNMNSLAKRMIILEIKNRLSFFSLILWLDLKMFKKIPVFLHDSNMVIKYLEKKGWKLHRVVWIFKKQLISPFGMYVFKKKG